MQTVIIVVHLFIVLALIGVVLLQRSEGGLGLGGGGGGGGGFMTGRGQANALTRATAVLDLVSRQRAALDPGTECARRTGQPACAWRDGR